MAITVGHAGQLASKIPTLAYRAGQASYRDQRRREEEARQMQLLQMQQQQNQFDRQMAQQTASRQQQLGLSAMNILAQQQQQQQGFINQQALQERQIRARAESQENYLETQRVNEESLIELKDKTIANRQQETARIISSQPEVNQEVLFQPSYTTDDGKVRILSPEANALAQTYSGEIQKVQQKFSGVDFEQNPQAAQAQEQAISAVFNRFKGQASNLMQSGAAYVNRPPEPGTITVDDEGNRIFTGAPGQQLMKGKDQAWMDSQVEKVARMQPKTIGGTTYNAVFDPDVGARYETPAEVAKRATLIAQEREAIEKRRLSAMEEKHQLIKDAMEIAEKLDSNIPFSERLNYAKGQLGIDSSGAGSAGLGSNSITQAIFNRAVSRGEAPADAAGRATVADRGKNKIIQDMHESLNDVSDQVDVIDNLEDSKDLENFLTSWEDNDNTSWLAYISPGGTNRWEYLTNETSIGGGSRANQLAKYSEGADWLPTAKNSLATYLALDRKADSFGNTPDGELRNRIRNKIIEMHRVVKKLNAMKKHVDSQTINAIEKIRQ